MSQAITYSEARQNLAETMNRVCDHHEPVIITRQIPTGVASENGK